MSSDHQKYSNQAELIAAYAASRGLTIVRTHADEGLSRFGIGWSDCLKEFIADVHRNAQVLIAS
ncbi:recombinase family protein [Bradyrhizobium australiense]|uniref:Recombinase family protein n=1 Tax=Bradyrhizobium australiense TaxID=2721161 RepID=A0A7Y4GXG1_9BRAD|nr:recombinase family protein [Bradyrhizobium australiense]NOJ43523.1 recombinase family protein [Bradyrhizobium australiense]